MLLLVGLIHVFGLLSSYVGLGAVTTVPKRWKWVSSLMYLELSSYLKDKLMLKKLKMKFSYSHRHDRFPSLCHWQVGIQRKLEGLACLNNTWKRKHRLCFHVQGEERVAKCDEMVITFSFFKIPRLHSILSFVKRKNT